MDQAHCLRRLARHALASSGANALVVAVSGARPGVGVTTVVADLARELVRLGKQTALIDASASNPSLAGAFRIPRRPAIDQLLSGERSIAELIADAADGLGVVPGAATSHWPPLDEDVHDRFAAELRRLACLADVILIDAGNGMSPWIDRIWQLAAQVLLVSPSDPQGPLDAYAVVKQSQYHRLDRRLRLVIAGARSPDAALADRFAETCERFLCIELHPPALLPLHSQPESHAPALRLLAADLACACARNPLSERPFAGRQHRLHPRTQTSS